VILPIVGKTLREPYPWSDVARIAVRIGRLVSKRFSLTSPSCLPSGKTPFAYLQSSAEISEKSVDKS
jgi:hypothetical protein